MSEKGGSWVASRGGGGKERGRWDGIDHLMSWDRDLGNLNRGNGLGLSSVENKSSDTQEPCVEIK